MGKGTQLSKFERGQINAFKTEGKSNRRIATLIGRSLGAVNEAVKHPDQETARRRSERPRSIVGRSARRLLRAASNSEKTARQHATEVGITISIRTVHRDS